MSETLAHRTKPSLYKVVYDIKFSSFRCIRSNMKLHILWGWNKDSDMRTESNGARIAE